MSFIVKTLERIVSVRRVKRFCRLTVSYQNHIKSPRAAHFPASSQSTVESMSMFQSRGVVAHGESGKCVEISKEIDCAPRITANTARGIEANPKRRATTGD